MSGLKVNFHKSLLVGVNVTDSWLNEAASMLGCKVGKVPFLYLGLSIGGDPRRLSFWEPVVARVKKRLLGWRSKFLSFGGRLVLLKSVLSSLPVYAFSFFRAPSGIISTLESLFINFFWGGSEDQRKISWVSWNNICASKINGGLGVRRMREFNVSLLGKWCWRLLVDKGSMWYRVLVARYGEEDGRLVVEGRSVSSWWKEVASIRDGLGDVGEGWFRDNVERKVGDGVDTIFWLDPWVGDVPLCVRFGRLLDLAVNKSISVADMFELGWDEGGEAWQWRRRLWAWEEELLGECRILLSDVSLQLNTTDQWVWRLDPSSGYSVSGVYQMLTSQPVQTFEVLADLIWHKQVPLKVSILAWRLLRNKLLTKDNLCVRGVLSHDNQLCVVGCGDFETAQHLFRSCPFYAALWGQIRSWLGIATAEPLCVSDHFYQFVYSAGASSTICSFLQLIWLCSVGVMWSERNSRVFKNKDHTVHQLVEKIKLQSFWWMKTTNFSIRNNFHMWWLSPFVCLGIC
ncbi:putative reverse transcriptase zinc-binding domain-containing protein [Medicago truncatula]|uniref:Putative reverse transcriptase zinc-binding domain-containing protein n=1 Tax=Medicago truncatula TaxID=3880 RepID=A0A396IZF2_MEDTR|nr:putative reverse transcriptase zinc-binding domain-containing protein [Medicago truncatula]